MASGVTQTEFDGCVSNLQNPCVIVNYSCVANGAAPSTDAATTNEKLCHRDFGSSCDLSNGRCTWQLNTGVTQTQFDQCVSVKETPCAINSGSCVANTISGPASPSTDTTTSYEKSCHSDFGSTCVGLTGTSVCTWQLDPELTQADLEACASLKEHPCVIVGQSCVLNTMSGPYPTYSDTLSVYQKMCHIALGSSCTLSGSSCVWTLATGATQEQFNSCYNLGTASSSSTGILNTTISGTQELPSIAINSDGRMLAIWETDSNYSGWDIYAQLFDESGKKLGSEFRMNTYGDSSQYSSSTIALADGFVSAWQSYGPDSGWGVYGQKIDFNGNKVGTQFRIETNVNNNQTRPILKALPDGGFLAMWEDDAQDGSGPGVYAQRFNALGQKVGDEFRVNSYTSSTQYRGGVTVLSNGNLMLTWMSYYQDGSVYGVYGKIYSPSGNPISGEFVLNSTTSNEQQYPHTFALPNGEFISMWQTTGNGNSWEIFGRKFDANGNAIGSEFKVNTNSAGDQYWVNGTNLVNGGFVTTWISSTGGICDLHAQMYNENGEPVDSEFVVATSTNCNNDTNPIEARSDGGFQVAWTSATGDTYTKRYNAAGKVVMTAGGTSGNDLLASSSSDVDVLAGGDGDDMYYFSGTFGNDQISDSSGTRDQINLTSIDSSTASFSRSGTDLTITLASNKTITIKNYFFTSSVPGGGCMEYIHFMDKTMKFADVKAELTT